MKQLTALWADEAGFILSAELVLIATVAILGLTVMLVGVRDSVGAELTDLSNAFRRIDQSYAYGGIRGCRTARGYTSYTGGSKFLDAELREPGSEDDIIVDDLELGCSKTVVSVPCPAPCPAPAMPVIPCPPPCNSRPCPSPDCQLPGCPGCAEHSPVVVPQGAILNGPLSVNPPMQVPCENCPPASVYGNVLPPPSSDIPPGRYRGTTPYDHWSPPDSPPIPKMPAGPLQVW